MGCHRKDCRFAHGRRHDAFTHRPVKAAGDAAEMISVARLTEEKGLHVAIEACRQR